MSGTEWLAARGRHITSTDSAKVLGVSPWGNVADVVGEKLRAQAGDFDDRDNEAMAVGRMMEVPMLGWASKQLGRTVLAGSFVESADDPLLSATLDGRCGEDIVEVKTHGLVGGRDSGQFGEPGTDEVPDEYNVQVQHAMYVAEAKLCWMPCLIVGRGRVMFRVERNDDLIAAIRDAAHEAWRHVERGEIPTDPPPSLETLKHRIRQPHKRIQLGPQDIPLLFAWVQDRGDRLGYERAEAKSLAEFLNVIGDAEEAEAPDRGLFTYHNQIRRSIDTKALAAKYPDIAREFERESTFPVPRFKPTKEETE